MNNTKFIQSLTTYDAMILQQVSESGFEDLQNIAAELKESKGSVLARLASLKHMGLVKIRHEYGQMLIALTKKGKMTINYVWA